tara:strand:- start:2565 stop:3176 length:612 start_codon:yes stop_codon:yes gene_type:complete
MSKEIKEIKTEVKTEVVHHLFSGNTIAGELFDKYDAVTKEVVAKEILATVHLGSDGHVKDAIPSKGHEKQALKYFKAIYDAEVLAEHGPYQKFYNPHVGNVLYDQFVMAIKNNPEVKQALDNLTGVFKIPTDKSGNEFLNDKSPMIKGDRVDNRVGYLQIQTDHNNDLKLCDEFESRPWGRFNLNVDSVVKEIYESIGNKIKK